LAFRFWWFGSALKVAWMFSGSLRFNFGIFRQNSFTRIPAIDSARISPEECQSRTALDIVKVSYDERSTREGPRRSGEWGQASREAGMR
jgi:hypothetical protein